MNECDVNTIRELMLCNPFEWYKARKSVSLRRCSKYVLGSPGLHVHTEGRGDVGVRFIYKILTAHLWRLCKQQGFLMYIPLQVL